MENNLETTNSGLYSECNSKKLFPTPYFIYSQILCNENKKEYALQALLTIQKVSVLHNLQEFSKEVLKALQAKATNLL